MYYKYMTTQLLCDFFYPFKTQGRIIQDWGVHLDAYSDIV